MQISDECLICQSKLWWKRVFANFTSTKSRIALQVARTSAPLTYLLLHSGQVLSSFKCYFKRKYLNLIDSNCDVDESCPWFFIDTVLATGPECDYQYICDIEEEKSLWDGCSSIWSRVAICCVGLAARSLQSFCFVKLQAVKDVIRMSPAELYSRNLDFCGEHVSNSGEN